MPFGAGLVFSLVVLQLSWVAKLRVTYSLLLVDVLACVLSEAADEDDGVEHGVVSPFLSGWSAVCGTRLPNGCAALTPSLGEWRESAEGDHSLPGGRSPHLAEAR